MLPPAPGQDARALLPRAGGGGGSGPPALCLTAGCRPSALGKEACAEWGVALGGLTARLPPASRLQLAFVALGILALRGGRLVPLRGCLMEGLLVSPLVNRKLSATRTSRVSSERSTVSHLAARPAFPVRCSERAGGLRGRGRGGGLTSRVRSLIWSLQYLIHFSMRRISQNRHSHPSLTGPRGEPRGGPTRCPRLWARERMTRPESQG